MKTYVVIVDPDYGQYVHLVKAESVEKAREIISRQLEEWSKIESITLLDDILDELTENESTCIGGYEE